MNTTNPIRAEKLIIDLKNTIDLLCGKLERDTSAKSLVYAKGEYGLMQRVEIEEIAKSLTSLKNQLDYLAEECTIIPAEMQTPDNQLKA